MQDLAYLGAYGTYIRYDTIRETPHDDVVVVVVVAVAVYPCSGGFFF